MQERAVPTLRGSSKCVVRIITVQNCTDRFSHWTQSVKSGSTMAATTPKILLVAGSPMGVSFLAARLKRWECEIDFASSCKEASTFVSGRRFDLVLSEYRLRDGSSHPLAASLIGSNTTLIYSYPVETDCWWLPAVKNGQSCWGSLAMRPSEFIGFLDDILKEIRSRQTATSEEFSDPLLKVIAK